MQEKNAHPEAHPQDGCVILNLVTMLEFAIESLDETSGKPSGRTPAGDAREAVHSGCRSSLRQPDCRTVAMRVIW